MKYLNRLLAVASAAFFIASSAFAQNTGTVTANAFAIGKGAGQAGFTSLLCGSAQLAVGQSAAAPICRTVTGDVTITAAGVTAIGAAKVTSAMFRNSVGLSVVSRATNTSGSVADVNATAGSGAVFRESGNVLGFGTIAAAGIASGAVTSVKLNADVFSTAHTWAGQQTFVAPILGTPASGTLTNATGLPIATGVSGLAAGVASFLATPSSANLATAITNETGSGALVFGTAPTISQPNLVGTTTNDSAAAGSVGEYVSSLIGAGSEVAITSAIAKTVTSISLTAGDWDVSGIVYHHPAATTSYTRYAGSISLVNDTLNTTAGNFVDFSQAALVSGGLTFNAVIPPVRISLAGTTTVYLIAYGTFTVSTSGAYGIIRARRAR